MLTRVSPSRGPQSPEVVGFYERDSGSVQYLVIDTASRRSALLDVVLDFDPTRARTSAASAGEILDYVRSRELSVDWILDTHPHADHFMASHWLRRSIGGRTAIGEKASDVAELWRGLYNLPDAFDVGRDFDHLFADGEAFQIGELPAKVMLTPGHTLASVSYLVGGDAAFVADTFMQPDFGTARADFPGGSARALYRSLQSLLALPDDLRLFVGHDYGTPAREAPAWESTVAEQRAQNVHVGGGLSEDEFVALRTERDGDLALPDRMLFALQVNLRGGRLPEPESDGRRYFRIPANRF